jgi:hypothetical protein
MTTLLQTPTIHIRFAQDEFLGEEVLVVDINTPLVEGTKGSRAFKIVEVHGRNVIATNEQAARYLELIDAHIDILYPVDDETWKQQYVIWDDALQIAHSVWHQHTEPMFVRA